MTWFEVSAATIATGARRGRAGGRGRNEQQRDDENEESCACHQYGGGQARGPVSYGSLAAGRGAAWLARWSGGPKVASSNLAAPTLMFFLTVIGVIAVAGWVTDQTLDDVREILRRRGRRPSS